MSFGRTKGTIYVCWNNPNAVPAEVLLWVENAVARTWEAYSAIDFVDRGPCSDSDTGVRITIADVQPNAAIGDSVISLQTSMKLNFTFRNWGCSDGTGNVIPCTFPNGTQQWTRQDFVEMIAVHEFGHTLGFSHEQNRPGTPSSCTANPQGDDGTVMIGA
ncbi:MAG: hypothetical protein JXR76_13670 [Deltaproteobacteria bacterium]|nr:hypothetical protein [Deltaproteobacteria bacterium]